MSITAYLLVVMFLIVYSDMSLSSSPVCGCAGLPQPRSSKMPAAHARGRWRSLLADDAGEHLDAELGVPRASDRKSVGIFFRGKGLRGGPTPSCWRRHRVSGAATITRII